MLRFFLLAFLGCVGIAAVNAHAKVATSHLQVEHEETMGRWLASRPNLRIALAGDCACKNHLNAERASFENYHPYYLVADLNGDKKDDFAIALVDTHKQSKKFAIVVFNGPVRKASTPAFFREGFDSRRMAFTAADGLEVEGRTSLFVQKPNTGKGWMLSVGRKGYFLKPRQEDFN